MRIGTIVLAITASTAIAGPINPPPGPVGPTGETLDQVNPGTPISLLPGTSFTRHRIVSGGRYYLDQNIIGGAGFSAIQVATSDAVTIDLNGFEIRGTGTEDRSAIQLSSGVVVIENGTIRSWDDRVITEFDATITLRDLVIRASGRIEDNSLMSLNRRTVVERCTFESNSDPINFDNSGSGGVQRNIVFRDCQFFGMPEAIDAPLANGVQIIDCAFTGVGSVSSQPMVYLGEDASVRGSSFTNHGGPALQTGDGAHIGECVFAGISGSGNGVIVRSGKMDRCVVRSFGGSGVITATGSLQVTNSQFIGPPRNQRPRQKFHLRVQQRRGRFRRLQHSC